MKRVLVTGCSGFVAHHYLEYLRATGQKAIVCGVDINEPPFDVKPYRESVSFSFEKVNLMDVDAVKTIVKAFKPTQILHLAAFSSVAYSWKHPAECFANNTNIFLNMLTAVQNAGLQCRILSVGSSEIYGDVTEQDIPLVENRVVNPLNPYAIARQSQEQLMKLYVANFGMDIIATRSFNHIGPWQDQRFVVPSFVARSIAILKNGASEGTIETGDVTIVRDFLDVRDVVRAYDMLLDHGKAGEIYNIASGQGVSLREVIDTIGDELGITVHNQVNPDFVRPDDNHLIIGCHDKITSDIGWEPQIPLKQTIHDIVEEMRGV